MSPPVKKRKVSTTDDEASFSDASASTSSVSGKYGCNRCDKSFNSAGALREHHRVHSPHRKPFECANCNHKTTKTGSLNKHIRRQHKQELQVNPDVSAHRRYNVALLSAEALELGIRDPAKDRPAKGHYFKCSVIGCGANFYTIVDIRSHQREHAHIYPYACTFYNCLKTFATFNDLHRHSSLHHYLTDLNLVNYFEVLQPAEAEEQQDMNELCHEIDEFLRNNFPFSKAKTLLARIINYNPSSIEDKSTFLYLFLHEDLNVDLPDWETNITSRLILFKRFLVHLVAYIGKGGEGRPEQHLKQCELERDTTTPAGVFFKELSSGKKKIIILKSTFLSNASASRLESCVIGSMKKGTAIVNTQHSLAKKTSLLMSTKEGNLASVLELYIIFLKYLKCTDEQVDVVIRQHTNVDEDFTHLISTPEKPELEASDSKVVELESAIVDLKAQLKEAKRRQLESESVNQQLLTSITDMDEQRNALREKLERAAETTTKQTEEMKELRAQNEHLKAKVLALEEERQQKSTTTINQSPANVKMEEDYSMDDDDFEQFDWSVLKTVTDAATPIADNDYTHLLETDLDLLENLLLPEQQVP